MPRLLVKSQGILFYQHLHPEDLFYLIQKILRILLHLRDNKGWGIQPHKQTNLSNLK